MTSKKNRKPYEKPRISEVKLEVTEAVLAACKSATGNLTRGQVRMCAAYSACSDRKILGS